MGNRYFFSANGLVGSRHDSPGVYLFRIYGKSAGPGFPPILPFQEFDNRMRMGYRDRVSDTLQMCEDIISSFRLKANQGIQLTLEKDLPAYRIWSDKNRLTQVLTNFITNALKFTHEGSITSGYRLAGKYEPTFYVHDTGIGIPEDKIPEDKIHTIFDRLVKLNNFAQGTGLGLSICKTIAEQMHGKTGVESEAGIGSNFWFTHPCNEYNTQNKGTL